MIQSKKDTTRPSNVYYGINWGYRSDETIEKSIEENTEDVVVEESTVDESVVESAVEESVEENTLDRSPSLDSGICSSIRHMTSCRMPPTFRVTRLFIFRDFDIRKGSGSCFSSYYNRSSKTLYYICCIKYLFGS